MKYKASLNIIGKIITASIFIIWGVTIYVVKTAIASKADTETTTLIISGISLLYFSIVFISYLYAPTSYTLEADNLIINRSASNKIIKLSNIINVREVSKDEMKGSIRTFGNGGLWGYYGKYHNTKLGNITLYTTQWKNYILIETKEKRKIIITPDDIDLLQELKEKIISK